MIFEEVKKNKNKTYFLVIGFFTFIAVFIYFLSLWLFENTALAVIVGLAFSTFVSVISYYNSDKIVLSINKARIATREEYLQINMSLEGLSLAAGLPTPKLYIIDDWSLNAFATGRNPEHSVVCVTKGLLNKLDKYEMEGVLAHELSHIKNYDILLATVSVVMVGFIVIISDAFSRGFLRSSRRDDDRDSSGGILAIVGLFFIILSPIFAKLLQLAISRNREYLADASAIELTRNNQGLINALRKLSVDEVPLRNYNEATAALYIVNPLKDNLKKDSALSTHPSIENRIAKLMNIQ